MISTNCVDNTHIECYTVYNVTLRGRLTVRGIRIKNRYNIIFTAECILFLILSSFFVPTNDDLRFAFFFKFDHLTEYLNQVLYYGNGRLLGNGIILFFSKQPQLFYPIEAVIVALFCIGVEKLIDLKNSKLLVMAFITMLPIYCYKEIISWMSAFINYFIPVALFVLTIIIIKHNLVSKSRLYIIALIAAGFCEQLFIEHNTIINILFAAMVLLYGIKKHMRFIKETVLLLISNMIGAGVMFLYNFYIDYSKTYTASFDTPYRSTILSAFSSGGIKGAVFFALKNAQYPLIMLGSNLFLMTVLFSTMMYIEHKAKEKNIKHKAAAALPFAAYILLFILCTYTAYKFPGDLPDDKLYLFVLLGMLFVISFLGLGILFCLIILKRIGKPSSAKMIALLFFAALSFAPFLLVSPCGYRCCFFMYFFIMVITVYTLKFAAVRYGLRLDRLYDVSSAVCLVLLCIYTGLYAREKKIYNYKTEYFKTSYYLPAADENLISLGDTAVVWDAVAGFEHRYIPLDKFELLIENGKI